MFCFLNISNIWLFKYFTLKFSQNEMLKLFSALAYDLGGILTIYNLIYTFWELIFIFFILRLGFQFLFLRFGFYFFIFKVRLKILPEWNVETFLSFGIWLGRDIDISSVLDSLGTSDICLCQQYAPLLV